MKAAVRIAPDGAARLEIESESAVEADLINLLDHQRIGRGIGVYSGDIQCDTGKRTLRIMVMPATSQPAPSSPAAPGPLADADLQDLAKATASLRAGPDGVPIKVEPEAVSPGQPIRPGVIGAEPAAEPLDLWPVIKLGRRVRLHPTGKPGLITRVDCSEGVGTDYMATLTIDFDWDAKAARYVPPTRDGVGEVTVTQGLPTNDLPLPAGYKVPDRFVTVTPQGVGSYAAPQAARCGACHACRGKTAQPACERELVATREAVRRLWCHVQAVNPAGLDRQSAGIHNELRREIEALACVAEVK